MSYLCESSEKTAAQPACQSTTVPLLLISSSLKQASTVTHRRLVVLRPKPVSSNVMYGTASYDFSQLTTGELNKPPVYSSPHQKRTAEGVTA